MPLYEYQCQSCGTVSEALQKMNDAPLTTCEKCGGPLKRLISAPAVQFKGTGWYVTDYARKGGGDAAKREQGEAAEKADKGDAADKAEKPAAESKTETKPAAESAAPAPAAKPEST